MRRLVASGLFLAWLANDIEEWITVSRWSERDAGTSPARRIGLPWLRRPVPAAHMRVAIGLMGTLVATASLVGLRTGGRSRLFQAALFGFGVHGLGHLALSVVHRGYTPGVLTAPTVVVPFSVWAWRELRRAGVRLPTGQVAREAMILLPAALGATHAAAGWAMRHRHLPDADSAV
ncbi:MAG: HXXEE domain-containing protein [Kutzneria sp.]|nr:HXXEE domain-containing protein [Kutzneria sp.]